MDELVDGRRKLFSINEGLCHVGGALRYNLILFRLVLYDRLFDIANSTHSSTPPIHPPTHSTHSPTRPLINSSLDNKTYAEREREMERDGYPVTHERLSGKDKGTRSSFSILHYLDIMRYNGPGSRYVCYSACLPASVCVSLALCLCRSLSLTLYVALNESTSLCRLLFITRH